MKCRPGFTCIPAGKLATSNRQGPSKPEDLGPLTKNDALRKMDNPPRGSGLREWCELFTIGLAVASVRFGGRLRGFSWERSLITPDAENPEAPPRWGQELLDHARLHALTDRGR